MEANYDYTFDELTPHIRGTFRISEYFKFSIFSDHAPEKHDRILIGTDLFEVIAVNDDTTDEEFDQGLSYDEVFVSLIDPTVEEVD